MKEQYPAALNTVTNYLKNAALLPKEHNELVVRALQQLLISVPVMGTALIWPGPDRKVPWKVYYAGARQVSMQRWLSARLTSSLDNIVGLLEQDMLHLPDMPPALLIHLHTSPASPRGLWLIWPDPSSKVSLADNGSTWIERVRKTLEALLEVEDREEQYFSSSSPLFDRELVKALSHGDAHALTAFLSLTRVVAKADFAFWAQAYQDVVETSSHLGAKHSGFGFALARGCGVGGRVAAYGVPIVGDYRNSPYRDPSVSDIVDGEEVKSGLALPVRYSTAPGSSAHVAAVLYATRRSSTHFSLAEYLLAQRLVHLLEPLPPEVRSPVFALPDVWPLPDYKAAWYDLMLHADRIETIEAWVSQVIKGTAIVTNSNGKPYVFTHNERLEQIKSTPAPEASSVQVLSLASPGVRLPGQIYLCPSVSLPPAQWPEFFSDLVMLCNMVIARMEQAQDSLNRRRDAWLRALLKSQASQHVEQEGYRLGLPLEGGQLWVLAWQAETMQATRSTHGRMIAENVVLDNLKSPLIFFDDDLAVVLLDEQVFPSPSKVRDALLKHCGAQPLWIVHGVRYHSLHELKMALTHAISLSQKARSEASDKYLLDIYTFGLDSLLENPRLIEDLDAFARKLLTPLIEYDTANSSHLVETFVLTQTLGSTQAAAEQLGVHVNTIRYRLHRAEEILGVEQASPKERTAMLLAAFSWQHFHNVK